MTDKLVKLIENSGMAEDTALMVKSKFEGFFIQAKEWNEKAKELVVEDESEVEKMKQAREARLALRHIRTSADKTRKELKADSIKFGRAVQDVYNEIESAITPTEEYLKLQEDFAKVQEEKRRLELIEKRTKIAEPYKEFLFLNVDYGTMSEEEFEKMIAYAKRDKEELEEKIRKQKEEEEAELKRQEEEREQQRLVLELHNERKNILLNYWQFIPGDSKDINFGLLEESEFEKLLSAGKKKKAEWDKEQERILKENERLAKEKAKQEEILKKERAAAEKRLQEERAKRDAELKKEREEREKMEEQIRKQKEKEQEQERIRKQQELEKQREQKELSNKSIKERLLVWVDRFVVPDNTPNHDIATDIEDKFNAFKVWSQKQINKI